jgi:hypothetical protein
MPNHADHDDFAFEHAPGLPAPLPKDEHLLWQGRPDAWRLATESLALRWVIGYFAVLALWRVGASLADIGLAAALASALPIVVLGALAAALLWGFCWLQARATVYTVTSARVILRIGAALQVTLQIPYRQLDNAALDLRGDGSGTLAFEPKAEGGAQLSYLVLWPHVRPWHMRKPQPAFRAIPEAETVARIVADAAEAMMARPQLVRRDPAAHTATPVTVRAARTVAAE